MRDPRTSPRWRRALLLALVVLALVAVVLAALAWRPPIDPIEPPARSSFEPQVIERGAHLARAGNCIGCHLVPGGSPFAGGLPLETPFGTLYSTNITPDPDTGIGRWSQEAFDRAMREGSTGAARTSTRPSRTPTTRGSAARTCARSTPT
jgi:mono/diheme cytochrome c family protein